MVLTGVTWAACVFVYDPAVYSGPPALLFQVDGPPLYDIRADSTAGGSGPQRWADPATWAQTVNPAVMIWNILRGIALPGGSVWGLRRDAADIDQASFVAAMNDCDVAVAQAAGGTLPAWMAGYEVRGDDAPSDVIEVLLAACGGRIAESGGRFVMRVGPPGLPVWSFTDEGVLVSRPGDYLPFPRLDEVWNGVQASYPEPYSLWEPKDAPPLHDTASEAADGRRRTASLALTAVFAAAQVRRLMAGWLAEQRRFVRHVLWLPPAAAALEPLDAVTWTSAANGYTDKLFEVTGIADDVLSGMRQVSLREVDPDDWAWSTGMERATTLVPPVEVDGATWAVGGFAASGSVLDAGTVNQRVAITLDWDPGSVAGAGGLQWQLRPAGGPVIRRGTTQDLADGTMDIVAGLVPVTGYEVRMRPIVQAPRSWTSWTAVTTPAAGATAGPTSEVTFTADSQDVLTLALGPLPADRPVTVNMYAEARDGAVRFRWRPRASGTWEGYEVVAVPNGGGGVFRAVARTVVVPGGYEDLEVQIASAPHSGTGSFPTVRNATITAL